MSFVERLKQFISRPLLQQRRGSILTHEKLKVVQERIRYHFKDITLLEQALVHRSYLGNSNQNSIQSNERLEFLGDAVLDLIISEVIYKTDSNACEGTLTKKKCNLVSGKMLSKIAYELGLGDFIIMSENEERSGGRSRPSILEDTFEALLGAIYLDGGLIAATSFLRPILLDKINTIIIHHPLNNSKSELLEFVQKYALGTLQYIVEREEGPDHKKVFHVAVYLNNKRLAMGKGSSKKLAEQNAARFAIDQLKRNQQLNGVQNGLFSQ
ncbi:MAG: ribonuclease III [bacterium]|nr:ribonuclease III [bacterium]